MMAALALSVLGMAPSIVSRPVKISDALTLSVYELGASTVGQLVHDFNCNCLYLKQVPMAYEVL